MTYLKTATLAIILGATSASFAHADLIINGGFEDPGVSGTKFLDPSQLPGWDALGPVELWNRTTGSQPAGPAPFEGNQYLELNSTYGGPYTLFQDFSTVSGTVYQVTFAHAARRNLTPAESFQLYLGDDQGNGYSYDIVNGPKAVWATSSFTFMATGETSRLAFTALNPADDTYGNFLDAVTVADVPEPGTLGLLALGMLGIGFARRRQANA
ncbi:DUF642 domain-containing protein [Marinobacter sp. C2H3]|uniref:DUF642 domain-containing protein n=1 Tax=Marinobacter sp. C2H3 TaxID=3119003 RepID=UPI00300F6453